MDVCGSSTKCWSTRSMFSSFRQDSDRLRCTFCTLPVVNSISCYRRRLRLSGAFLFRPYLEWNFRCTSTALLVHSNQAAHFALSVTVAFHRNQESGHGSHDLLFQQNYALNSVHDVATLGHSGASLAQRLKSRSNCAIENDFGVPRAPQSINLNWAQFYVLSAKTYVNTCIIICANYVCTYSYVVLKFRWNRLKIKRIIEALNRARYVGHPVDQTKRIVIKNSSPIYTGFNF